jgi:hypothetical protein
MAYSSYWRKFAAAQSAGAAVTAAAATSLLPAHAKKTFAAGFWSSLEQGLWIKASGKCSTVITTPGTLRFDVRFGATVVFDGLAVLPDTAAAHTDRPWWLEIMLSLTTVGSAATLMGAGIFSWEGIKGQGTAMPVGSVVANLPWNSTPANGNTFDATASQQLDLFFTQTVATGSITLQQYWAMVDAE